MRIEGGKVRPEGCICEPCSDIPPNWKDIRTKFGYKPLYAIMDEERLMTQRKGNILPMKRRT